MKNALFGAVLVVLSFFLGYLAGARFPTIYIATSPPPMQHVRAIDPEHAPSGEVADVVPARGDNEGDDKPSLRLKPTAVPAAEILRPTPLTETSTGQSTNDASAPATMSAEASRSTDGSSPSLPAQFFSFPNLSPFPSR